MCKYSRTIGIRQRFDINLSGSDSPSEQDDDIDNERIDYAYGLVTMASLSEYVENCFSQNSNRLINKVNLRVFALFYFTKHEDTIFVVRML